MQHLCSVLRGAQRIKFLNFRCTGIYVPNDIASHPRRYQFGRSRHKMKVLLYSIIEKSDILGVKAAEA